MWTVQIFLAVVTKNNGKPDQQSGCAINLSGTNGKADAQREFTQYLGDKNQPQAEIYTALAALTAIKARQATIQIFSNSTYLTKILTKKDGEWGTVDKNQGMVAKLREAFDSRDTTIAFDNTSDRIKNIAKLARASATDKSSSDSNTQLELV